MEIFGIILLITSIIIDRMELVIIFIHIELTKIAPGRILQQLMASYGMIASIQLAYDVHLPLRLATKCCQILPKQRHHRHTLSAFDRTFSRNFEMLFMATNQNCMSVCVCARLFVCLSFLIGMLLVLCTNRICNIYICNICQPAQPQICNFNSTCCSRCLHY